MERGKEFTEGNIEPSTNQKKAPAPSRPRRKPWWIGRESPRSVFPFSPFPPPQIPRATNPVHTHTHADEKTQKYTSGLTARTERNLAEKAGHLEILAGGKGRGKGGEGKKG